MKNNRQGQRPRNFDQRLLEPLREGLPAPTPPTIVDGDDVQGAYESKLGAWKAADAAALAEEAAPKLWLLLDHYAIARDDPERWFLLSLKLAIDHVPGFTRAPPGSKPGRPSEWDAFKLALVYCLVEKKKHERLLQGLECSDLDACRFVLQDPGCAPWVASAVGRLPAANTLRNRYLESQGSILVKTFVVPAVAKTGPSALAKNIPFLAEIVGMGPTSLK